MKNINFNISSFVILFTKPKLTQHIPILILGIMVNYFIAAVTEILASTGFEKFETNSGGQFFHKDITESG